MPKVGMHGKIALGLFLGSLVLHIVNLGKPHSVVFDEVHFGKFTTAYCCSFENIFDIHPPHAKLLIAGAAKIGGYQGGFGFEKIGDSYDGVPIVAFRFFPALAGSLIPSAVYWVATLLGASTPAALLVALFVFFDNAMLVQTRVIALDGILLLATLGAIGWSLIAKRRDTKAWLFWGLAGGAAGLAVGTKFTGLVAPGLIGVIWLVDSLLKYRDGERDFRKLSLPLLSMAVGFLGVYLLGWVFHFMLLTRPGFGDAFYRNTGNFWTDLIALHKVMLSANAGLKAGHSDGSPWWSWPLMTRPIYYWVQGRMRIYFLGNPVVWWGASFGFVLLGVLSIGRRILGKPAFTSEIWIPVLGFFVALVPYMGVTRVLFLYHYLPPLFFALLALALFLDEMGVTNLEGGAEQRIAYLVTIAFLILGFVVVMPFSYGFSPAEWQHRVVHALFPVIF